ncbi:chromatin assembly protein [Ilyonectria robusta]|uniref:chromatin assembly protein n=1 Tax=Ilyonectria robusta TaxID=1079257 RepID=UPI001E8D40FC|nr:chromatin assembly protein [Ilyonectria robusta]KAH8669909.1 chromatin assembly protein [Ilyonectria robusta]
MVLFKRKPVQFLPPAEIEDENAEVWHIPQTGEIFVSYEDYLSRMDFYKQRRFNDQITGHSGLTFFEAFKSELAGGKEVEASFPEALKGPILRRVQFQTVSRLDNLVDQIYEEFKHDYYPGEDVTVTMDGGDRVHGLVRDKTAFGPRSLPDGSQTLPTTRYLVNLKESEGETIVTDEHICRDRGIFTKAMLRSFIKKTVTRDAWNGAPWLVKHEYASQYHIDTRVPPHLRYDTKVQERKQLQAQKRASLPHETNGHSPSGLSSGPMRLPELKPAPKGKSKPGQAAPGNKALKWPLNIPVHGGNPFSYPPNHYDQTPPQREPTPPPPPPPPPKYPIEDLQLDPREDRKRPPLKYLCKNPPVQVENGDAEDNDIDMDSVGPLLETWDTLNVYCEVFKLDSFTFDDFVETLCVASEEVPVQLFEEIHCSVLKILVDSEADGGKVRINLPEIEEDDSDEEDEDDEDESAEPTPEPEPKPVGRATRSSMARLEAERMAAELAAAEAEDEDEEEEEAKHRAEELLKDYDWIEHLRKRDFTNGGWERIMVGLLHQLSKSEHQQEACEELLFELVPADVEPTQDTVRQAYAELDVNFRVKALQIICMLTTETKAIRGYMEDCSETMTTYRKEKIEWQRQRKQAVEDLRQMNEQRKVLLPDNMPPSPAKTPVKADDDVKMTDVDESHLSREEDGEETEEDASQRKRKRAQSLKQRKREEELAKKEKEKEKEKKKAEKKAEKATKPPAQSKQFIKLLKDIQKKEDLIKNCEEEIAVLDNDLREADCPRTRVLGKDRFWNRYYWFERNGMPYGGLPDSSTASADYANGCIWVQGPDDLEREGYIDLPSDLQDEYKGKFNMTVPERKTMEEGKTSVFNARQWGYISDPEHVDALIKWLDPRGFNELRLRKELLNYKEKIAKHMENRKTYLANTEEPEKKEETKRMSTRIRDKTPEPPNYRCLQWENTTALEEVGHLHSDPPPPPRARKQTKKREAMSEAHSGPAPKTRRRRGG